MNIRDILNTAMQEKASDVFIVPGYYVSMKVGASVSPITEKRLSPNATLSILEKIYTEYSERKMDALKNCGDDDFSFSIAGLGRFRINAYRQRGSYAAVIRCVSYDIPDPKALNIPDQVLKLTEKRRGIILVTGSAGSGKSTTLACLTDRINRERSGHIITLEDPIEFLHSHKKCVVSQREIKQDTDSYATALRAALRQAPDVILLGEMRDLETIHTALTAVETGQLLLSSLHTIGAAKTIDRIIDVFPAEQQQQVRMQFSLVLQAIVSQQLIPAIGGGVVPAFEVMISNNAIQNMIRESKVYQMDNVIHSGASEGMISMDADIFRLYKQGKITAENAILYAMNPDQMRRKLDEKRGF